MKTVYAQYLQLAVTFAYCLIEPNFAAFLTALTLLAIMNIHSSRITTLLSRQKYFTSLLVLSVSIKFVLRIVSDVAHHSRFNFTDSLSQPITISLLILIGCKSRQQANSPFFTKLLRKRYAVPIYLFLLSLLSNQENSFNSLIHVGIFCAYCFLFRIRRDRLHNALVLTLKLLLVYEVAILYLDDIGLLRFPILLAESANNKATIGVLLMAIFVGHLILRYDDMDDNQQTLRRRSQNLKYEPTDEIQMQDLTQKLLEQPHPKRTFSAAPNFQTLQISDQSHYNRPQQTKHIQSYNLAILYPFFIYNQNILEIPIYVYMLVLQYTTPPKFLRYLMYLTATLIYVKHELSGVRVELLALSLVLMLDWEVSVDSWLTNVKALWLRWCFVIVLAMLFWFGLRQVNLFHLALMIILLLFITKSSETGARSFRNKNWKYLLAFFNCFVAARYVYSMMTSRLEGDMVELAGLSYDYNEGNEEYNFNLLPMLMDIAIVLQYWTYKSRIYQQKSKKVKDIFRSEIQLLQSLAHAVQVIYYKSILWISTTAIIIILLFEDFAVSSGILLTWILVIFILQISQSNPSFLTYLWLLLSRLIALQIIMRYFFEFTKFDKVYKLVQLIPTFQFLLKYQKLLGLSIDYDPSIVYLHTITKFQLTITLDIVMIFLAFLAIQYLTIIIKYRDRDQNSDQSQRQKVLQIYQGYILFSITRLHIFSKVRNFMTILTNTYVNCFYLIVGIYACSHPNFANMLLLGMFAIYYLRWNSAQDGLIVSDSLLEKVKEKYRSWLEDFDESMDGVKGKIKEVEYLVARSKVKIHQALRKYMAIFFVVDILLIYATELLYRKEIPDFLSEETILYLRWLMYLGGTSKAWAHGYFSALSPYIVFLFLLIIELKFCKFIANVIQLPLSMKERVVSQVSAGGIQPIKNEQLEELGVNLIEEILSYEQLPSQHIIKQIRAENSMAVSTYLALNKIIERSYVMLYIFDSTIQNTPFSIPYIIMGFILNYYGTTSLLRLSKTLVTLIILQYSLILLNFENTYVYSQLPPEFIPLNQHYNPYGLISDAQWNNYLTFGKNAEEFSILLMGILFVASYQFYYYVMIQTSKSITKKLENKNQTMLGQRFFRVFKSTYRYLIVLNPLYVTLLSVGLYLSDFTLTNLILCCFSTVFLLRQFLADQVASKQHTVTFWKAYFRLLQGSIILFMVGYYILSIPRYRIYCTPLLCSDLEYRTKVVKALLVFLFQIGIDLLKSSEFNYHMDRFLKTTRDRASILRLAIAFRENDRRLEDKFKIIQKRKEINSKLKGVLGFLEKLKHDPKLKYQNRNLIEPYRTGFINSLLGFLPRLIDPLLLMPTQLAAKYLSQINASYITGKRIQQDKISDLDVYYNTDFIDPFESSEQIIEAIEQFNEKQLHLKDQKNYQSEPLLRHLRRDSDEEDEQLDRNVRESVVGFEKKLNEEVEAAVRETVIQQTANIKDVVVKKEKAQEIKIIEERKFMFLRIVEAIISNWQHITFLVMVIAYIKNNGLLTVFYPVVAFLFGLVQQYQADKLLWRVTFCWTIGIVILKYLIGMQILNLNPHFVEFIVGNNLLSVSCEFFLFLTVLCQAVLMHTVGLFKQTVPEVESMRMALIRNAINDKQNSQQLIKMLEQTPEDPSGFFQNVFSNWQHKVGYDYSAFVTTIQIICLVYSFLFYDRMYIDQNVKFYSVAQYNQFTGGMVIWMLIQLLIMLLDRFIYILNLSDYSKKWDISLLLKFVLQLLVLLLIHFLMVYFIPNRSSTKSVNNYCFIFYILYCLYFFLSALQIRDGIDRMSRGFMERYVWYNGYFYTTFRAVPFLFQFKVFSDWFVTKTTMRLFDWIKFQDTFGRLFVAKCNSLFLQGKIMGSKIEWWKKLLMGFPLLMCIVLLIFGPLVLFSSLNPLASYNHIVGGSTYVTLKINRSNEYPLYMNSHISSIRSPTPLEFESEEISSIIENYNVEKENIQIINLEEYSDTYWEISEGSEQKLLQQPQTSMYQLLMTIKFYREYTSATPIYQLNSIVLPLQSIPTFKQTLNATAKYDVPDFYNQYIRLDNNNGLHYMSTSKKSVTIRAERGKKVANKYWVIEGGLEFVIVSDKYSKAIFGYSVMGFYISIILVVANYFRFIFQGGANLIMLTDIPVADPLLTICQGVYLSRLEKDLPKQDELYWTLIDLIRSPDTVKLLTGNYLDARLETLKNKDE